MSVRANNSHERKVITLQVYDVDGHADGEVEIPWSECLKAISALVGVYGFIDPAGAQSLFRAEKKRTAARQLQDSDRGPCGVFQDLSE